MGRVGVRLAWVMALWAGSLAAATLSTDDGLSLTLDGATGAITAIRLDGAPLNLTDAWGGLTVQRLTPAPPVAPVAFDFNADGGPWTDAQNADWESPGGYVTWQPSGGPDGSAHLLLGDGATAGAGMAITDRFPVEGGMAVTIGFQMKTASTETKQILAVRVYDESGVDITQESGPVNNWIFSGTSQAHVKYDFGNALPGTWEPIEFTLRIPQGAAMLGLSLRHWTGGDHLVHIDDLSLTFDGGYIPSEPVPLSAAPVVSGDGFTLGATLFNDELEVDASIHPSGEGVAMHFDFQAIPDTHPDMPLVLRWNLPVAVEGWTWWDDIAISEVITSPEVSAHTFTLGGHENSWYPLSAVTSGDHGLGLAVPMDEPLIQRFEADPQSGLVSTWFIGLAPLTEKIGQGHAEFSLVLERHDPAWGFRSALRRYQDRFPHLFEKRTTVEGAWQWPVPVTEIASPEDFGFGHQEHWQEIRPLDDADLQAQRDAGIVPCAYVEPWIIWQGWADYTGQPPTEVMLERLELEASNQATNFRWVSDGGVADTGHLVIGDGFTAGAGMAFAELFSVTPGETLTLTWSQRASDIETKQIPGFRCFNSLGEDITETTPAPSGWIWTLGSRAHVQVGFNNSQVGIWEIFQHTYTVPPGAERVQFSLRHWTGGDHRVQIDDLSIVGTETLLNEDFDVEPTDLNHALNSAWDSGEPVWHRGPRSVVAQMVLNSTPQNADGLPVYDDIRMWHPSQSGVGGSMRYPLNADPDLAEPSAWAHYNELWFQPGLALDDGIYFDSTTASGGIGGWLNFRLDHLAAVDHPLTFDTATGRAAQIGVASIAEYLGVAAPIMRAQGERMMMNLFPHGNRHLAHWPDTMGYEVTRLDQDQADARLQRSLAGHRIVSNLLQLFINPDFQEEYATHEQMEAHFLGQVFWGFFPSVSSNGKNINGAPDRYFDHPELYNRDRPLFQQWMPIVAAMNSAGWEPVTHARGEGLEVERFGAFERGEVFFSIRAGGGAPIAAPLAVDLVALQPAVSEFSLWDMVAEAPQPFTLAPDSSGLETTVSLTSDEVVVLRLTTEAPSGLSAR